MADPITPIAMAGAGADADMDRDVRMAERCLAVAEKAVSRSLAAQAAAGAKAIVICEPAANSVYLSPRQIDAGSDIFERFVIQPNLRLRAATRSGTGGPHLSRLRQPDRPHGGGVRAAAAPGQS